MAVTLPPGPSCDTRPSLRGRLGGFFFVPPDAVFPARAFVPGDADAVGTEILAIRAYRNRPRIAWAFLDRVDDQLSFHIAGHVPTSRPIPSEVDVEEARRALFMLRRENLGMVLTPGGCWVTRDLSADEERVKAEAEETLRPVLAVGVWAACEAWLISSESAASSAEPACAKRL